jgi:Na+/H+-dicarboxylate symporter
MKEGTRVLVALGSAVVLGLLIASSGNTLALRAADALAPVGILWVTAIRMTVIPLLVALIVTGVASASDVRDIGRMGASALVVFLALLIAEAAIVIPAMPLLFSLLPNGARPALPPGAAEAASDVVRSGQTPTVASWMTSLLPSNPVSAAASTLCSSSSASSSSARRAAASARARASSASRRSAAAARASRSAPTSARRARARATR